MFLRGHFGGTSRLLLGQVLQMLGKCPTVISGSGVWLKFECVVFSIEMLVFGVKRICLYRQMFVFSTISVFVFCLEVGLETPQKEQKLGKKCFCESSFQVGMKVKKGQKQDRAERTQKGYLTSAMYFFADVKQSSCILSSLPCFFLYFFQARLYLKWSFAGTFPLIHTYSCINAV